MPYTNEAIYNEFGYVGEDISGMLLNISPFETPLLDALSAPSGPALNIAHQWEEHQLSADVIIASAAVNSATAATGILINGTGLMLQAGMLLEVEAGSPGSNEIVQVTSAVGANSVLVSRNFGSRGVSSLVAGGSLTVISTALIEGADALGAMYRPPTRKTNYCQIFGKEIIVTGTARAVQFAPNRGDLLTFEAAKVMKEVVRDLEKAVIRGAVSGNSIGSASAYRTMDGLRSYLTSINSTVTASSFAADPVGYLTTTWQSAYNAGARDIDLIVCGPEFKKNLSAVNAIRSYLVAQQSESGVQRYVDNVMTDFGQARVIVSPWMPASALMGISTRRTFVLPLRGRQFGLETLAKTGDADKAQIIGEYTVEVNRGDAMFHLHV